LCQNNLYLKPEKCKFERERVEYLGLVVSKGKVEMDAVKVDGVSGWFLEQRTSFSSSWVSSIPTGGSSKTLQVFPSRCTL